MLDIRHLNHIVALADERHFARAAARVHLSQPAFSRSIQSIEESAGMRLFDRETGEVKPTPAGEFLIERARRLLFDARGLARDVNLYRENQLGDTAFGAGPFPARTLIQVAVPLLRQRYPAVALRIDVSNWQRLFERLLAEDLEFFVADVRDLPPDARLSIESLGRQPGRLYVRKEHPLAGARCSLREAWAFGVAATRMPAAVRAALTKLLDLAPGETAAPTFECDDLDVLRALTLGSDAVLAFTDVAARPDVERGALIALEVSDLPTLYAQMGAVRLRNRTLSPMGRLVLDCITELARSINEGMPALSKAVPKS